MSRQLDVPISGLFNIRMPRERTSAKADELVEAYLDLLDAGEIGTAEALTPAYGIPRSLLSDEESEG